MPAILPGAVLPNYALLANGDPAPSQGIFIPLASLPGLTAGEANAGTGDGRKVCYEFLRAVFTNLTGLATNARPARMSLTRSNPTGVDQTTIRQAFTATFDLEVSASDVAAEP